MGSELNYGKKQIEWRRARVLELSSQGNTQHEIANKLQIAAGTVNSDLAYLKMKAQQNLKDHIHQTIPEEYQKACNTLNQVLRMTWSIVSKTEDEKTRLQALALINDVNKYRTELVTNGVIVNDSLRVIQSKVENIKLNTIHKLDDRIEAVEEEIEKEEEATTNGIF